MQKIIRKIIQTDTRQEDRRLLNTVHNQIEHIISQPRHHSTTTSTTTTAAKIAEIDATLMKWNLSKKVKRPLEPDRQEFISQRICKYLESGCGWIPKLSESEGDRCSGAEKRIVDIGGGNGNVLAAIGRHFGVGRNHLICIENREHEFHYPFDNGDAVQYRFYEDVPSTSSASPRISLSEPAHYPANDPDAVKPHYNPTPSTIWEPAGTVDLVICMVSLHHMQEDVLKNTLQQIYSMLAHGGILLVKEHDCTSEEVAERINWEHHLYHIVETPMSHDTVAAQMYLDNFVGNYKSRKWLERTCCGDMGLELLKTFNNILEPLPDHLDCDDEIDYSRSPTQLFWQLYRRN
jgi:2-polyprenyl-3-methyl-5-hydroxy-6-metoxy-1,4-benzoquinol methylase